MGRDEQPLEGRGMLRLRKQIEQAAATVVDDDEDHIADLIDDEPRGIMQKRDVSDERHGGRSRGDAQRSRSKAIDARGTPIGDHPARKGHMARRRP